MGGEERGGIETCKTYGSLETVSMGILLMKLSLVVRSRAWFEVWEGGWK